jgi:hypothetical protein
MQEFDMNHMQVQPSDVMVLAEREKYCELCERRRPESQLIWKKDEDGYDVLACWGGCDPDEPESGEIN